MSSSSSLVRLWLLLLLSSSSFTSLVQCADDHVTDSGDTSIVHPSDDSRELMEGMYTQLECNGLILDMDICLTEEAFPLSLSNLAAEHELSGSIGPLVIPCGKCAIVDYEDGSTVTLPNGLDIVGRLHFPLTANVIINTTAVFVQGQLDMTEPAPNNAVKLTLYGVEDQYLYPYTACSGQHDAACMGRQNLGTKPIAVAGGRLNVIARSPDCHSWTHLVEHVSDTELEVSPAFAACVKVGDPLLIASASNTWSDEKHRNVAAVNSATGMLTLDAPISTTTDKLPGTNGPGEPEFAVEVATLSRSVVFHAQNDNPQTQIGGHLIIFHTPTEPQRLSGVRFDNFGQGGILGRYPIHWHMSDVSPSIISGNVIVNSNQRCVVIHDTNGVTVQDNVAYKTKGHCYITETGAEENNVFASNLGVRTELLYFDNGQSDSPTAPHEAATFWIRNMRNEFYGNVAAGSESIGWWFEMPKKSAPSMLFTEPTSSFRDNVAHSCADHGFTTYKQGWLPSTPAVFDNIKNYKNGGINAWKSHWTGQLTIQNSLFADNKVDLLYGIKNNGIILKDTRFLALSDDMKERKGESSPNPRAIGIKASYNVFPSATITRAIVLDNVIFERFISDSRTMDLYFDTRRPQGNWEGMGDPIEANVAMIESDEDAKPYFDCGANEKYTFLEDVSGGFSPSGTEPGFIIRNEPHMKAFLPSDACTPLTYGGSFSDGTRCNAFCKNVCIRYVHIRSGIAEATKLVLTQGDTSYAYYLDDLHDKFRMVLPGGSYQAKFYNTNDIEVIAGSPVVSVFRTPKCTGYADQSSFVFSTGEPTMSPSLAPSLSFAPTKPYTVPINLSQGKEASQICNYSSTKYPARHGNDGIISTRRSWMTHTCKRANAWWKVDLGGLKQIESVEIWNRPDCCQSRLSNFYVQFLDEYGDELSSIYNDGYFRKNKKFTAGRNVFARYVRIQLTAGEPLHLMEVKVLGWDVSPDLLESGASCSDSTQCASGLCTGESVCY